MKTEKYICEIEKKLRDAFNEIDITRGRNQVKVLNAMREHRLAASDFSYVTGYGYDDAGRDRLDRIYACVFGAEDALVRHQIISGTHAISISLFANLSSGDTLLSVYDPPYDTLLSVIGAGRDKKGSLCEKGVSYDFVAAVNNDAKYEALLIEKLRQKPKVCLIQRSKGYAARKSLRIDGLMRIINIIREFAPESIIIVDNCYGEFVEELEPPDAGADLIAGSLIKNPGGGIAPCGGYLAGKKEYIRNCEYAMTCPGIGREAGPSLGFTRDIAMGLFFAPHVTAESLKAALLCCEIAQEEGYDVAPDNSDKRGDIVQGIIFRDKEKMISFCRSIQKYSPVDSFAVPCAWDMPGYEDKVIMASGAFTQGSSIEMSCDAPLREPFTAYFQGGLFYDHARYALINAFDEIKEKR